MTITRQEILDASILIVDDQPANVTLLEELLHGAGYTNVSSTMNPKVVCELQRKEPFDLILLDLQMPGMDGFEVMAGLQDDIIDDYLPVLVTTAQPTHKLRALQAGAKDFVSKPFDLLEVKTRIHNMIEVRLLHQKLAGRNKTLEQMVEERTAELRESEARYRGLTELATDWYWEQDPEGKFVKISGATLEMLGLGDHSLLQPTSETSHDAWDETQRQIVQAHIAARRPFLDMKLSRVRRDGTTQQFRVSGTPMFDRQCTLIGYRGFGVEIFPR